MDYLFPDIDSPLFVVKQLCLDDNGKIIGAAYLKVQAETYLSLDPDLSPVQKMEVIDALNPAVEKKAWEMGLETLCAYIPEPISRKFTKRLRRLGWDKARDGWITWFRELGSVNGQSGCQSGE
jgi:hypothetical protein